MGIVVTDGKFSRDEFKKVTEDYGSYIKITIDIKKGKIALGGEYHADAEKLLLDGGSAQDNLWGGGINLETQRLETNAIINLKPHQNPSVEILEAKIRKKFLKIAHKYLKTSLRYYGR